MVYTFGGKIKYVDCLEEVVALFYDHFSSVLTALHI